MTNGTTKITELTATTSIQGDDLFVVVINPDTTPVTYKMTATNVGSSAGIGHDAVTIGTNTAAALSLSAQQLSINDVFVQIAGDTMTGALLVPDGTVGAPPVAFSSDPDTGIYYVGLAQMGFAAAGSLIMTVKSQSLEMAQNLEIIDGTVLAPSLIFANDADTGIYRVGVNQMGFAAGNSKILEINTTGLDVTGNIVVSGTVDGVDIASRDHDAITIGTNTASALSLSSQEISIGDVFVQIGGDTMTGALLVPDGAVGAPSVAFSSDIDTGIYYVGLAQMGFAAGGALKMTIASTYIRMAQNLEITDGSAVAPSFLFTNDTDTGLYLETGPTNPGLAFTESGTARMVIGNGTIYILSGTLRWDTTMGNSTKNPETDAEDDWIEVMIGGTTYYIPVYAAS